MRETLTQPPTAPFTLYIRGEDGLIHCKQNWDPSITNGWRAVLDEACRIPGTTNRGYVIEPEPLTCMHCIAASLQARRPT